MKTLFLTPLVLLVAGVSPALAGDFGPPPGVYADPYGGIPLPPRPVPGYGATETVVTTTRRVVAPAPYGYGYGYGYGGPPAVVTTRRVVAPAPAFEEDDGIATGPLGSAYPLPPRRVLKSGPDYGPVPVAAPLVRERVVVRRAEPVVIEERRVVTTRRILHPAPAEDFGWDE
ncbi:MAG TPA: hypothetical protein VF601_03900 [Beijerinckiaceae bacterium]|jgi:hypothetical protein